jgi:cation transport regulator ChaC
MDDALWYFGYGSNMSRAIFVERRGMKPMASHPGRLDGHGLRFNLPVGPGERGVANLEIEPGARIWGVLYRLSVEDCKRLDRSEGVHVGLYQRIPVEVTSEIHGRVTAFTYRSSFVDTGRKPSARYMDLLLDGAREQGLPEEYVVFLQSFVLAVDERRPPTGSGTA